METPTFASVMAGILVTVLAGASSVAGAQGFSAYVSPPRFEVKAAAGQTSRHVVEIHQASQAPGRFRIYTNDWDFQNDDSLQFSEALAPDSCRPWVALERRELTVPANARYRFRFEIAPPADTPPRECRFAIMVEGLDVATVDQGSFRFPVAGRLGVIVYVAVAGAEAKLAVGNPRVAVRDGERLPVVDVTNSGNAHGRLEGFLSGTDAAGKEFELIPEDSPVLPGRTRAVTLRQFAERGEKPPAIQYPLTVKGTLEWGKRRESLDLRFEP